MVKKLLTFLVSFVLIISVYGKKDQFTINGNVDGFADSTKLYLHDMDTNEKYDSTIVIDGKFQFKGSVDRPKPFMLGQKSDRRNYTNLWVENIDMQITGTSKNLKETEITGSEIQKQADSLESKVEPISDKSRNISIKMREMAKKGQEGKEKFQRLRKKLDSLRKEEQEIRETYISNHPKSIVSAYHLTFLMRHMGNKKEAEELYNKLDNSIKSSVYGKQIKNFLKLRKEISKGEKAPDFTLPNVDGDSLSLSDYRGEYVLLDFWAAWCGPCRKFNERLLKNYKKFKEQDFNIFSVSLDKNREDWVQAIEKDSMLWDNVSSLKGYDGKVAMTYNINKVPTNYLINPEGKILAVDLRGKKLDQKLKEIFADKSGE